jgi:hypothetical protein
VKTFRLVLLGYVLVLSPALVVLLIALVITLAQGGF